NQCPVASRLGALFRDPAVRQLFLGPVTREFGGSLPTRRGRGVLTEQIEIDHAHPVEYEECDDEDTDHCGGNTAELGRSFSALLGHQGTPAHVWSWRAGSARGGLPSSLAYRRRRVR